MMVQFSLENILLYCHTIQICPLSRPPTITTTIYHYWVLTPLY